MQARGRNLAYAGALLGLISVFGALPWYFSRSMKSKGTNLMLSEAPLGGHQVMRGPYINSGSHDAGLDTNWRKDPVTGKVTYFGSSKVTITPELADAYRKEKEAKAAT